MRVTSSLIQRPPVAIPRAVSGGLQFSWFWSYYKIGTLVPLQYRERYQEGYNLHI